MCRGIIVTVFGEAPYAIWLRMIYNYNTHIETHMLMLSNFSLALGDAVALRISRAYAIWSGLGMSIQGVRTCGDYMFSGHTVALTIMNFFITECKHRWQKAKTFGKWNMFILRYFFISPHRYAAESVFPAHINMAIEYVRNFLHIGGPRTLFDWCFRGFLYNVSTLPILPHIGK